MKKILFSCFVLSLVVTPVFAQVYSYDNGGVMCTRDGRICVVGNARMSTNGSKPLQVYDGVVCTPDGNMCTNGYYNLYTSGVRRI